MSGETDLAAVITALDPATGIGVLSGTGRSIDTASARALELLGRSDAGIAGVDVAAIIATSDRSADDDATRQAAQGGASDWFTATVATPDGSCVDVDMCVVAGGPDADRWIRLLRPTTGEPAPRTAASASMAGALLRLARRLAGAGALVEVLAIADRLVAPALDAAYANIALVDETGSMLHLHHDVGLDDETRQRWTSLPVSADTLLGDAVVTQRTLVYDDLEELRRSYPSQGADAERLGYGVMAATPMRADDGTVLGVLGGAWPPGTRIDVDQLRIVADLLANAVALARDIRDDHRLAEAFQEMLLPADNALAPDLDVAVRYHAVERAVGGDFYDLVERGDDIWIIVGDVAGHGINAARTMGKVRFFIRALTAVATSPADLLHRTSRLLSDERQYEIVSCLVARCRLADGTIDFASAGHPPPIVLDETGSARTVTVPPMPPLGFATHCTPTDHVTVPTPRRLVLYTDGLVERRRGPLQESIDLLLSEIDRNGDEPVDALADRLVELGISDTGDDLAIVCVDFAPAGRFRRRPATPARRSTS